MSMSKVKMTVAIVPNLELVSTPHNRRIAMDMRGTKHEISDMGRHMIRIRHLHMPISRVNLTTRIEKRMMTCGEESWDHCYPNFPEGMPGNFKMRDIHLVGQLDST